MSAQPNSVDAYLADLPGDQRAALQRLRQTIRAAAPDAEERIAYGIPTFRYRKKMLLAYGAGKAHLALYTLSAPMMQTFADADAGEPSGKGTVRFQPAAPLPDALVRRAVAMRMAEIDG